MIAKWYLGWACGVCYYMTGNYHGQNSDSIVLDSGWNQGQQRGGINIKRTYFDEG